MTGGTVIAGTSLFGGLFIFENGTLTGDGTIIGNVVNFGDLEPGCGVGTLAIDGAYAQQGAPPFFDGTSGTLHVELEEEAPGGFDRLVVSGLADLGGGLFVELGYEPALGESFQFVEAGSIVDKFDVALFPGLTDQRFMRVTYGGAAAGGGIATITVEELSDFIEFGVPAGTVVPGQPSDAVVGDFDGDGFDDIALTVPAEMPGTPGDVIVLINDGTGMMGFSLVEQVGVGVDPSSITAGLLDADGVLDLAVTNAADDDVTVLFGVGDGTFGKPDPKADIPVGDNPISIAAANLDTNDGNVPGEVDLVVANAGSNEISVILNNGDGTFPPDPISLPSGMLPGRVDPVDVDNDKDLELIVANQVDGTVMVFENFLGGNFGAPLVIPVGDEPVDLMESGPEQAGFDLDQNGFADIVTANLGDGTVSVIVNQSTGPGEIAFAPAVNLPVGDQPVSLTALDMDLDTDIDLAVVVSDAKTGPVVVALRNDLNGGEQLAFAESEDLGADAGTLFVLSGDLDGDEDEELITVNEGLAGAAAGGPRPPAVTVLPNLTLMPSGCPADTNGDGMVDVKDLVALILAWGPCADPCPPSCPGDLDESCVIDVDDLVETVLAWGACR